jgi:hypothetical protein
LRRTSCLTIRFHAKEHQIEARRLGDAVCEGERSAAPVLA